jgi:hypothetical protein
MKVDSPVPAIRTIRQPSMVRLMPMTWISR